jgi:hypothetical protein
MPRAQQALRREAARKKQDARKKQKRIERFGY